MKLLYLTQTFPPEPGATLRPWEQARCLVQHGHAVDVLTTFPYYPNGVLQPEDRWALWRREDAQGFRIFRIASLPASNRGTWRRLASWASFAAHAVAAGLVRSRPEAVIASVPNPGTEAAGWLLAKAFGVPFVLELRDLLPDTMQFGGLRRDSMAYRIAARAYHAIYRRSDLIAVPCEGMVEALVKIGGIDRSRIVCIPHGADRDRFGAAEAGVVRRRLGLDGKFVVAYAGSFSPYYGVKYLVEAAARMVDEPQVHWLLVGDGADRRAAGEQVDRLRLANVTIAPAVSPAEVPNWLAAADLCITSRRTAGILPFRQERPTKLCDYLALGKPILAVEDETASGPFLARIGAGFGVSFADPEAITRAVRELSRDARRCARFGAAGRRFADAELSRDRTMLPLLKWLDEQPLPGGTCARVHV